MFSADLIAQWQRAESCLIQRDYQPSNVSLNHASTSLDIMYFTTIRSDHLNYKYPLGNKAEEDKRWQQIVVKNLNAKCRGCRKKVKSLAMEQQENTLVE